MIIQYVICANYGQGDVIHEDEFDEHDRDARCLFAQRARHAWNNKCACVTRPKPISGEADANPQ